MPRQILRVTPVIQQVPNQKRKRAEFTYGNRDFDRQFLICQIKPRFMSTTTKAQADICHKFKVLNYVKETGNVSIARRFNKIFILFRSGWPIASPYLISIYIYFIGLSKIAILQI